MSTDPHARTGPERPWALSLIPPFPPVALAILSLTAAQDVNGGEIAALIRRDASFTAELLRVANSALFGFSRRVASVSHAVVLLGLDRVKGMAMFVALRSPLLKALRDDQLKRVWLHTNATAMIAERLADRLGLPGEEAYTAGLLHNLGALGLMCAYPSDYARLLASPVADVRALLQSERDLFGIDHCAAGERLAREWKLPETIASVAASHHAAPVAGKATQDNVVRIAVALAGAMGFAPETESPGHERCQTLLASCGLKDSMEELKQTVEGQLAFVPVE